jgi:hypothetical protein
MPVASRFVQLCWSEEIGRKPKRARGRGRTLRRPANPVLLLRLFFLVVFLWIAEAENLTAGVTRQNAMRPLGFE